MKNLRQLMYEANGEQNLDTHEVMPGFIGYIEEQPFYIHAILDRVAVISPVDLAETLEGRSVVNLGGLMVWPQDVRWAKRPKAKLIEQASQRRGYEKMRLVKIVTRGE